MSNFKFNQKDNCIVLKDGTVLPLQKIKGKDYLLIAWRLVWFRKERPAWGIETEYKLFDDKACIARASVKDEQGRVIAQGTKTVSKKEFDKFIEKAETGAIGRALALCGYGTQFEPELDEGELLADSPVARPQQAQRR